MAVRYLIIKHLSLGYGVLLKRENNDSGKIYFAEAKSSKTVVLSHPYFPHDIYINVSGIKEWLNQPHRHYAEKNEALLNLPKLMQESEYLDSVADPKGRDYIVASHLFRTKIAEADSWIIVNETIWSEFLVHSVSDNIPYTNEKQSF